MMRVRCRQSWISHVAMVVNCWKNLCPYIRQSEKLEKDNTVNLRKKEIAKIKAVLINWKIELSLADDSMKRMKEQ